MRGQSVPRRSPRPSRATLKTGRRPPTRALVDSEPKAVAGVDRPVGHDLPGAVHDQEEIGELVAVAVVVE